MASMEMDVPQGLLVEHDPEMVLNEAARAATALRDVISKKAKPVMMNGEQYLEYEDWQTVARFFGCTVGEEGEPEYVSLGDVRGFKAHGRVIDRSGRELSRATAYCLSDEEKWSSRTKYVWAYVRRSGQEAPCRCPGVCARHDVEDPGPDEIVWVPNPDKPGKNRPLRERVVVGEESVPLFQLASMAQTRAGAKALRNVFAWVVVLAGYKATPAEEMGDLVQPGSHDTTEPPRPGPARTERAEAPAPAAPPAAPKPAGNGGPAKVPQNGEKWQGPCPKCGKAGAVICSRFGPGWLCWEGAKNKGCGYKWTYEDALIHAQAVAEREARAQGEGQ